MNNQEVFDLILKNEKAKTLTEYGIEQFNRGNFENALSAFEQSFEINPQSIPNTLYYLLSHFSVIRDRNYSKPEDISQPEIQNHIRDMISKLEIAKTNLQMLLD